MIFAVDPVCRGFSHAHVNAALLATVRHAWADESLVFTGEKSHVEAVGNYLSANQIRGVELRPLDYGRFASPMNARDKLAEGWFCRKVLTEARRAGARSILFTASYTPHLVFLNILLATAFRDMSAFVVAHSLMQNLLHEGGAHWQPKLRTVLRHADPSRLTICVPGACIREKTLALVPDARLVSLDLAYFFPARQENNPVFPPVRFGFLGVGSRRKGIDLFYRMAAELTSKLGPEQVRFHLVGRVEDPPEAAWAHAPVIAEAPGYLLSEEERAEQMKPLHVAVFPYASQQYQLVASAAFLDAVSGCIPVIALRTPYFEEQFRRFGDIGILCDSYEEIIKAALVMVRDIQGPRRQVQRENLARAQHTFSPETLAGLLSILWSESRQ